ncbi:MAG: rRNA maturation RNase YbeY [Gammaproteobacteria bacterium]
MKRKGESSPTDRSLLLEVDLQVATKEQPLPGPEQFSAWIGAVLAQRLDKAEVTVRIVDEAEGAALNERFRGGSGATNVLAFPFESPIGLALPLLGDIVICAPVVRREAQQQGKDPEAHWAHMVVHGALHLLGYDHQTPPQADHMESLEQTILAVLGFPNPYVEASTP